jgi:hypothetical protein
VLLLAGCALPDGVDADLVGGWMAMPDPVGFVPAAEVCHDDQFRDTATLSDYEPVPCDQRHVLDTVHVGQFGGEAADRHTPPPSGSPEMREAYQECNSTATDYLGADHRHGRLWLGVVLPSRYAWDGGARWFRCDLGVWRDHESRPDLVRHEVELRGALAQRSEVSLGCYTPTLSSGEGDGSEEEQYIDEMRPVKCTDPHSAEFVGVWTAPDTSYLDADEEDDELRIHRECRSLVADYVGVPDDGDLPYRTGTVFTPMAEWEWDAGDRGFRCYLWLSNREVDESLKDAGTSGLPLS